MHHEIGRPAAAVGDAHLETPVVGGFKARLAEPCCVTRLDAEADRLAGGHGGHHRRRAGGGGKTPAPRHLVEGAGEARVAQRGRHRMAARHRGAVARQTVGAPVATEKRDDRCSVLGHGQQGRFVRLVDDKGRHRANQDSGGADTDDGHAGREEFRHMVHRRRERDIGISHPVREAVHAGAGQASGDPPRHRQPRGGKADHRGPGGKGHRHASPRR